MIMKSIEVKIDSSQIMRAEKLYDFNNLKNSITKGDSQIYGAIGEILVMDYLKLAGIPCEYVGSYEYDLISDVVTIDVKTKRCDYKPEKHHNANIPAYNTKQKTFMYFWVYVSSDMKRGWLAGWLDKETFFTEANFFPKGADDHSGWEYKADTYSMHMKDLICPDDLISNLKQIHMSKTKQVYEQHRDEMGIEFQPQAIYEPMQSKLYKALADFQQEVPVIHKATQGYGYTYADLTKIIQVINPLLAKHKLGYTQPLMGSAIKTIVFHTETGESIESIVDIPQGVSLKGMNDFQVLGSAISYLRRYSLASILTLITDADLDASGEQVKKQTKSSVVAPVEKPKLNDADFIKLCGAINAKKMHNGQLVDKAWAERMYSLTAEQVKSIEMLNN